MRGADRGREADAARAGATTTAVRDALVVTLAGAGAFALAVEFEIYEGLYHATRGFETEYWDPDELPVAAFVGALAMAWYARRRRAEARAEVTRRLEAEREARRSEERFRGFAEASSDWFWETDAALRFTAVAGSGGGPGVPDPAWANGRPLSEAVIAPGDPHTRERLDALLAARRPFRDFAYAREAGDGRARHFRLGGKPVFDAAGAFRGYRGTGTDETARVEAERHAASAEARLADAAESVPVGIALFDSQERLVLANAKMRDLFPDLAASLVPGTAYETLLRAAVDRGIVADARENEEAWVDEHLVALRARRGAAEERLADGRWLQVLRRPTSEGGCICVYVDVTEVRRREQELQQAQRLRAMGQFTGGVAHDLNNLLTVVLGNLQLLETHPGLSADEEACAVLAEARAAGRQGAEFVGCLLAFARCQPLRPRVVDLAHALHGMGRMARAALGQTVELNTVVRGEIWPTRVDPVQLEAAVLNLVVNARDATAPGGTVTLELADATLDGAYVARDPDATPGEYALLRVTDTGAGMPPEVAERAFEPFFTTKEAGRGSGLGLSMVYGFVKQSGGHVKIHSRVGHGTSVSLYLPRATEAGDVPQAPVATPAGPAPSPGGTETILVAEDEPGVRRLARSLLGGLGYRVIEAADGREALDALARAPEVALLFADVAMPRLGGRELAERARRLRPGLRTLFTSGYPEAAFGPAGPVAEGARLIRKPYTREELAREIRGALDDGRA